MLLVIPSPMTMTTSNDEHAELTAADNVDRAALEELFSAHDADKTGTIRYVDARLGRIGGRDHWLTDCLTGWVDKYNTPK